MLKCKLWKNCIHIWAKL